MNTEAFLGDLKHLGVELAVTQDGQGLICRASRRILTGELREKIAARKSEILGLIRSQTHPTNPTSSPEARAEEHLETRILDPGHRCRIERNAARASGVELFDWAEDPGRDEAERETFRAEILARADAMIAEVGGPRPPPNESVRAMFTEARARFGSRDLEERSITSWIRKNAPEVAALWPEAPLDASWFAWRSRVGREQVDVLDSAWRASLRRSC